VRFPWLAPEHSSDWARLVAPGAGAERGLLLLPEIDDEVLVGFELGDINQPYVLGGVWSRANKLPAVQGDLLGAHQVRRRALRSRSGHLIVLDDDAKQGSITIEDRAGNRIQLDTASNTLTIKTGGDTTIEAGGAIHLTARGQLTLEGRGVKIDGGPGKVDIDGSIVELN
jgi:uncharacterized protein involved in type VI secretion and phage assembly